jgi:thioredoxin 1
VAGAEIKLRPIARQPRRLYWVGLAGPVERVPEPRAARLEGILVEQLPTILLYVLAGAAAVVAGLQVSNWLAARRLVGRPAPDLSDLLGPAASGGGRTLYYFYSARCVPCHEMTPRIDRLSAEHAGIVKVDIGSARDAAIRFGVMATPTVVVVEDGKIVTALVGPQSERRLRALCRPR